MQEIYNIFPLVIIGIGILVSLIIEMYSKKSQSILPWISIIIFLFSGFYSLITVENISIVFKGMLATGGN
ncbi:MAG TPA: NADH-quinone oxidoreductase subunit N, partial [Ignavibacteriaceae bacterium]